MSNDSCTNSKEMLQYEKDPRGYDTKTITAELTAEPTAEPAT